jgi:uncharacterized LabA/DUF88 family protein
MNEGPRPDGADPEPLIQAWSTLDEQSRPKLIAYASRLAAEQAARTSESRAAMIETPRLPTDLYVRHTGGLGNFHRAMIFVDGENLARRYGEALKERNQRPILDVYMPGVLVWYTAWMFTNGMPIVLRKYYYTSTTGDEQRVREAELMLKRANIEAPRVFQRVRDGRSKQVDIALSTDMLLHATRRNFDVAVLVTGDADFIPLIEAVQAEGISVQVWALSSGLSPALRLAADAFTDLDPYLLGPPPRAPAASRLVDS